MTRKDTLSRRDFLGQVTIALAMAGYAHTIPAQAFEPEPELKLWTPTGPEPCEIRIDAPITGLTMFRDQLIINTYKGVFIAPSEGVLEHRFKDDRLFVTLHPDVYFTFNIQYIGHVPYWLEETPTENLAVARNSFTGGYEFARKSEVGR